MVVYTVERKSSHPTTLKAAYLEAEPCVLNHHPKIIADGWGRVLEIGLLSDSE